MKQRILFCLSVLLLLFLWGRACYAQIAAFDSACYFPRMGYPNEMDTIYGGKAYQHLGDGLASLPPLKGEQHNRLVMEGLPENISFLSAVETGPSFDLHKLNIRKKFPFVFDGWSNRKYGHFRSPQYTDMMIVGNGHPIIYWADENGEYDSSRYTMLFPHQYQSGTHGVGTSNMLPYIGKFVNDSVDDIIVGMFLTSKFPTPDSAYLALVKGGQQLFNQGKVAMWDDTVFFGISGNTNRDSNHRNSFQGDWRGVGREDLITVDDWSNYFYYRNGLPFDLHNFVRSLKQDTLIGIHDWSLYKQHPNGGGGDGLSMRAFPKAAWDKSVDFLMPLPFDPQADPNTNMGICVFKGGQDFGSKRLSMDSSDFFIHCPGYYDADFSENVWPYMMNGGDLTGTGNPVLLTSGGAGIGYSFLAFYVLGKAMDDKIDVFAAFHYGSGSSDTIRATNRDIPTFISSSPVYESPEDQANGVFEKGRVEILYGSEKIPVHLNPKFAATDRNSLDTALHHLLAYPNPCDQHSALTFDNCSGQLMIVEAMNSAGEICLHEETPAVLGLQQYALFLNDFPAGAYHIRLTCPADGWSATTSVIKTGPAITPWKLNLHQK